MGRAVSASILLVVLVLFAGACSKTSAPAVNAPSFRTQIAPVLERTCASEKGCHGESPVDWIDMDLRAAASYRQLVNAPTETRGNAVRVSPGSPGASFILDKLEGNLRAREGKQMPLDSHGRTDPSLLPPGFIQSVLVPWIAAGAPDN